MDTGRLNHKYVVYEDGLRFHDSGRLEHCGRRVSLQAWNRGLLANCRRQTESLGAQAKKIIEEDMSQPGMSGHRVN